MVAGGTRGGRELSHILARNAAYLLEAGELPRLVAPLVVQEHEEGLVVDDAGERHVARVMAQKR